MGTYEIKLNKTELDIVMKALGELPMKESFSVFNSINAQYIAQRKKEEGNGSSADNQ